MNFSKPYIYDPKLAIEKERLSERDKRTSTRRLFALKGQDFEDVQNILDVGCGNGVAGFDLLSRTKNASLVGVDLEVSILQEAIKKSPKGFMCDFSACDGNYLPFEDSIFDLVTCQYLLQHVSRPLRVLEEMRRLGRDGAKIVVFEWDDGVNFSYPSPPKALQKVFQAKITLIHDKG